MTGTENTILHAMKKPGYDAGDIRGLLRICKEGLKIIFFGNILLSIGISIFSKDWLATRLVSSNLFLDFGWFPIEE